MIHTFQHHHTGLSRSAGLKELTLSRESQALVKLKKTQTTDNASVEIHHTHTPRNGEPEGIYGRGR